MTAVDAPERPATRMARAGLCSRREAERWIAAGRVALNGVTLDSPAALVGPDDALTVDGAPVGAPPAPRLWLHHKPRGRVTTHADPDGRPTVFAHLPPDLPRVVSVGRLDLNSEGLLVLTNDGAVARRLERPENGFERVYRVRVRGTVDDADLAPMRAGAVVDGIAYAPVDARIEQRSGAATWVEITLREGKNREIRRLFADRGHDVARLIRVRYGPFTLDDLPPGAVRPAPKAAARSVLRAGG
ncbi:MAG: pseudouridine synthase [Pseudomonadota bacterium]